MDDQNATLFDATQPAKRAPDTAKLAKEQKIAQDVQSLKRRLDEGELDDVRTRVAYVLNQYPSSRNSDVELAIRYWKMFHPEAVGRESIEYNALRRITPMTSIARARATIQNTFGLFVADEAVAEFRTEREGGMRKRQRAAARQTPPLVYVYADESGKTDKLYIIGSLWVNDADEQMYKLDKTLTDWKKSIDWKGEAHFAEATAQRKGDYLNFVRQAMAASEYIGFKAVVLARDDVKRRPTDDAIFNLYYRLIVDGMRHEVVKGRLVLPRSIVVRKDEDEGADKLHLLTLKDNLQVECPKQFDRQLEILTVSGLKSSSSILMQLADVFTGSVNRIVNRDIGKQRNHKDEIAEGVVGILGADWRDLEGSLQTDFVNVVRL